MNQQNIDPQQVTPEQFVELAKSAGDEEVAGLIRQAGTEQVLDRIFEGMQERFLPGNAAGVDDDIQFVVNDEGTDHPYVVAIHNGSCEAHRGQADEPKVTLITDLVSFIKLITGQAQGPQLFMAGKIKISGDLMFSTRIMNFFDRPKS